MSSFKDLHCTGDVTIDGDLSVQGGPIDITPTLEYTEGISELSSTIRYIQFLRFCSFHMRATRSATFDGGSSGEIYILATIPQQYAPNLTTPLSIYAAVGSLDVNLYAHIDSLGQICMRMIGKTNPQYFYLSGQWFID